MAPHNTLEQEEYSPEHSPNPTQIKLIDDYDPSVAPSVSKTEIRGKNNYLGRSNVFAEVRSSPVKDTPKQPQQKDNGQCKHGLRHRKKSKARGLRENEEETLRMNKTTAKSAKDETNPAANSGLDYHVLKEQDRVQKMKIRFENDYRDLFNKWREYDFYSTFFAIIGLVVACFDLEHGIAQMYPKPDREKYPNAMDDPRNKLVAA